MNPREKSAVRILLGLGSAGVLIHFWVIFLAPRSWGLRYPGGFRMAIIAIVLSSVLSLFGAKLGGRWCYWITAAALATFVYFGAFYHPKMWF